MIWLLIGVASIFWDPGMGEILPLLPIALLGLYWNRENPVLVGLVLYFHHVLSLNTGLGELLMLVLLIIFTEIDKLFLTPIIPFAIFSGILSLLIFFQYGVVAFGVVAVVSLLMIFWRVRS